MNAITKNVTDYVEKLQNPDERLGVLIDAGNNLSYTKDVLDALENSPDDTDDGYDKLISTLSVAVATADLMSGSSKKDFYYKDGNSGKEKLAELSGREAFAKVTLLEVNQALVGASFVNAIKHANKGNYDKAISNGLVSLQTSIGVLSQTMPQSVKDNMGGEMAKKARIGLDGLAFGLSMAAQIAGKGQDIADWGYEKYEQINRAVNYVKNKIDEFAKQVSEATSNAKQKAQEAISKAIDGAIDGAKEGIEKAKDVAKETKENVQKEFERIAKEVSDFAKDLQKQAKEMFDGMPEKISKAFEEAVEKYHKIVDGVEETWSKIIEKILDLPDHIAGELPKWLGLNRNGKHYFYDPLVLDLDGDGIETLGHNKKLGAMFDLECVNDGVYGLAC